MAVNGLDLEEQVNALNDTKIASKHMLAQNFLSVWLHVIICAKIYAFELGIARFGMCFVFILDGKYTF